MRPRDGTDTILPRRTPAPSSTPTTLATRQRGRPVRVSRARENKSVIELRPEDESMSTTGTETTIGFQLSLGGKSDHGAQQGDGGAGQSRSTEVATLGRDSENDVQPLFEGVHLLFVEKVWNDVEAQMLQLLARAKGCHIHTDTHDPRPTWLLLIPDQDQEEPKRSGQGMRLAFGLGLEWQSLESLYRVKSQWVKDCCQSSRLLDHRLYGLKSIVDPDKYPKGHPQRNFVSCRNTDVLYRLLRILQNLDSYFARKRDKSSETPGKTEFYRIQDRLDSADGKRFSSLTRGFMAPYTLMLEHACPPLAATAKQSSRKPRVRRQSKVMSRPQVCRSPAPILAGSEIAPSDLPSLSRPTSDVTGMAATTESPAKVSAPSHPVSPTSRSNRSASTSHTSSFDRNQLPEPESGTSPISTPSLPAKHSIPPASHPEPTLPSQIPHTVPDDRRNAAHALLHLSADDEGSQDVDAADDELGPSEDIGVGFVADMDHPRARTSISPSTPIARSGERTRSRSLTPVPTSTTRPISKPDPIPTQDTAPTNSSRKRKLGDLDDSDVDIDILGQPRRTLRMSDAIETQGSQIGLGPDDAEDERAALHRDRMGEGREGGVSVPKSEAVETALQNRLDHLHTRSEEEYPSLFSFEQLHLLIRLSLAEPSLALDSSTPSIPDNEMPSIMDATAVIATRDASSIAAFGPPSSPISRRFLATGSEFLPSYYELCCDDLDLDHSAALKLAKGYRGGLDIKEETEYKDLFILSPLQYGDIWTVVLIDVYRQKTICVHTAGRLIEEDLAVDLELWVRLLLANLVCAAGREYFASATDYTLYSIARESGMNVRGCLDEESPLKNMITLCNLSAIMRRLVEADPSTWQQAQDPSALSLPLFSSASLASSLSSPASSSPTVDVIASSSPSSILTVDTAPALIRQRFQDMVYLNINDRPSM